MTAATPGVVETSFCSVCSRGSVARGSLPAELDDPDELLEPLLVEACAGEPSETAMISGPLTPGPKFCEIRSYARRSVVEVDSAATSFCPRFSDSSGTASGIKMARAANIAITGCRATPSAHRAHTPLCGCAGSRRPRWRPRTRSELMCGPVIASMAGSRVSAARTATMTAIAAIRPMVVTSGMLATASDTSAMVTVQPANTTAPPEVATARAIDSRMSRPLWRPRKCRVTMNSA